MGGGGGRVRWTERVTEREWGKGERERGGGRETDGRTDRRTGGRTYRETDRQADRQRKFSTDGRIGIITTAD